MRKATKLFIITLFYLIILSKLNAQTTSIDVLIFPDLTTLDFASFAVEKDLINQQRIFQVVLPTSEDQVMVECKIQWQNNDGESFKTIATFKTFPFASRSFYNDEIDNSEIKINEKSYSSGLLKNLVAKGKPTGLFKILVSLYSVDNVPMADNFNSGGNTIAFLNPTPPTIILPEENGTFDVGSILVQWTPSVGAANYVVLASYFNEGDSKEAALYSSTPLVDNKNVGDVTSVNLRDILDKELLADKNIVIVVKAIVPRPGGEDVLISPIVSFKTNPIGIDSTVAKTRVDPNLLLLAEYLKDYVSQSFIDSIINGEIALAQIQITDENNNLISMDDLLSLLTYLKSNNQSLISVKYTAQ